MTKNKLINNTDLNTAIIFSADFGFWQNVFLQKRFEDGKIPNVDYAKPQNARSKEGNWKNINIEEALIVHPSDDEDPDEEGDDVEDGIPLVLHRLCVCASDDVKNPGFVKHGIDFCHKTQNCKPDCFVGNNSASEADDD